MARSIRFRQVSRPSTSSVSNKGGAFFLPHTATRMGWNIWPGFDFQLLRHRRAGRHRERRGVKSAVAKKFARALQARPAPGRGRPSAESAQRDRTAGVRRKRRNRRPCSTSRNSLMRSWISGAICLHLRRCPRPAHEGHQLLRQLFYRQASRICSAFSHTALGSNGSASVKFTTALL